MTEVSSPSILEFIVSVMPRLSIDERGLCLATTYRLGTLLAEASWPLLVVVTADLSLYFNYLMIFSEVSAFSSSSKKLGSS